MPATTQQATQLPCARHHMQYRLAITCNSSFTTFLIDCSNGSNSNARALQSQQLSSRESNLCLHMQATFRVMN